MADLTIEDLDALNALRDRANVGDLDATLQFSHWAFNHWPTVSATLRRSLAQPAAVPGLVFGEPGADGFRQARASDGQVYTVDRMALARRGWFWCWIDGEPHVDEGYVDTEAEAIAAANAHNAARLKGGE